VGLLGKAIETIRKSGLVAGIAGHSIEVFKAAERAQLANDRVTKLARDSVESKQMEDEARLNLAACKAVVAEAEAQIALLKTYLDWTVIRSPINGVVLEKLVDANELVTPQSFGGTRGPSTALMAVADPSDLQVEIDVNESDLAKVLSAFCGVVTIGSPRRLYDVFSSTGTPVSSRASISRRGARLAEFGAGPRIARRHDQIHARGGHRARPDYRRGRFPGAYERRTRSPAPDDRVRAAGEAPDGIGASQSLRNRTADRGVIPGRGAGRVARSRRSPRNDEVGQTGRCIPAGSGDQAPRI
jgi:hypothetical protein